MVLKIPIHTLAQGMQLLCFSHWRIFTIKQDVGITRTLKTPYFHVRETTNLEETTKIYVKIYNKNKPLNHAFCNKT